MVKLRQREMKLHDEMQKINKITDSRVQVSKRALNYLTNLNGMNDSPQSQIKNLQASDLKKNKFKQSNFASNVNILTQNNYLGY